MKIAYILYSITLVFFCYFCLNQQISTVLTCVALSSMFAIFSNRISFIFSKSKFCKGLIKCICFLPICLSMAIALSFAQKTIVAVSKIGFNEIFLQTSWMPHDPESPKFGIWPPITGTILISIISITITTPLAIISSLYALLYANKKIKFLLKIAFNIPASIPSVVYGYFGVSKIAPIIFSASKVIGIKSTYENALVASITVALMIMPIMFSITYDSMSNISKNTLYNSYALGYTKAETALYLILPGTYNHIVNAILIITSRIIAETMIVILTAGQSNKININPLNETSTATSQIIDLILGDCHSGSNQFLMGYVLSFLLFIFCLLLNTLFLFLHSKNKTNKILKTFNMIYRYKKIKKKRKNKPNK